MGSGGRQAEQVTDDFVGVAFRAGAGRQERPGSIDANLQIGSLQLSKVFLCYAERAPLCYNNGVIERSTWHNGHSNSLHKGRQFRKQLTGACSECRTRELTIRGLVSVAISIPYELAEYSQ
jgi:hypothetical protein